MNTNIGNLVAKIGADLTVDICKKQKKPKIIAEKILLWKDGKVLICIV